MVGIAESPVVIAAAVAAPKNVRRSMEFLSLTALEEISVLSDD
jgi:hypothetical protein